MKITDLLVNFGTKQVFDNFCLDIEDNSVTAILGASGVGKTTLLNAISGLIDYQGKIEGVGRVAYVFQEARLVPTLTVKQNLLYALGKKDEQTLSKIDAILDLVGLKGEENSFPSELSGGMESRVSLARAFLSEASLLLMDEPMRSLDAVTRAKLIEDINSILKVYPRTVLMVTHDVREGIALASRIVVLKGERARIVLDEKISKDMTEEQKTLLESRVYSAIE